MHAASHEMNQPVRTLRPSSLWIATAILMVMALGLSGPWRGVFAQPGIDLYQLWGIAKCQRSSGNQLGSPYLDRAAYQKELTKLSLDSADPRLAFAMTDRETLDLTGTPLIYYVMGSLPSHYGAVLQVYRLVLLAAFAVAVFLLARRLAVHAFTVAMFSAAVAAAFAPLLLELMVANVNCIQLLGLLLVAETIERGRAKKVVLSTTISCCLVSLLVFLSLAKPNFDSVTILLAVCLIRNSSGKGLAMAAAAVGSGALLLLLPCLLFHTWSIWGDWWTFTFRSGDRIAFPVWAGNYSAVRLLAEWFGTSLLIPMAALAAMLLLSFAVAVLVPVGSIGGAVSRLKHVTGSALSEPYIGLSGGILLEFALSPLVWSHYLVLAIVPALWLCGQKGPAHRLSRAAGWLSLLLMADLPANLNAAIGGIPAGLISMSHAFGWVFMWLGLMLVLRAATAVAEVGAKAEFV